MKHKEAQNLKPGTLLNPINNNPPFTFIWIFDFSENKWKKRIWHPKMNKKILLFLEMEKVTENYDNDFVLATLYDNRKIGLYYFNVELAKQ